MNGSTLKKQREVCLVECSTKSNKIKVDRRKKQKHQTENTQVEPTLKKLSFHINPPTLNPTTLTHPPSNPTHPYNEMACDEYSLCWVIKYVLCYI